MKPIVPWLSLAVFVVGAPLLALAPGISDGLPWLQWLPTETYAERLVAIALCYAAVVVPAVVAANVAAGCGLTPRRQLTRGSGGDPSCQVRGRDAVLQT